MKSIFHHWRMLLGLLLVFALIDVVTMGTLHDPNFWSRADWRGDALMKQKRYAEAAKVYADPDRIGAAQYRNGDFEAAAHSFARVPGAVGAYNAANAWLMHGKYDDAIRNYDRALRFKPGWKEAKDNKALAMARRDMIEASGKDREKEQTGQKDKPDEIAFDQKETDLKQKPKPKDLSEGQQMSDDQLQATWLRRVQTTPGDFLKAKFSWQARQQQTQGKP